MSGGEDGGDKPDRRKVIDIRNRKPVDLNDAQERQSRHRGSTRPERHQSVSERAAAEARLRKVTKVAADISQYWSRFRVDATARRHIDDVKDRFLKLELVDLEVLLADATEELIAAEPFYYLGILELYQEKKKAIERDQDPR